LKGVRPWGPIPGEKSRSATARKRGNKGTEFLGRKGRRTMFFLLGGKLDVCRHEGERG